MELNQKTFLETYSRKETEELLSLHSSGQLTSDAYDALETVLRSRGIEPVKRPTPSENDKEKVLVVGWGNFFAWLLIALSVCVMARRIFLSDLPSPANVMPGSLQDIITRIFGDIVMFIFVFIIVSIPTILFSKIYWRGSVKVSIPRLLKIALVWTIIIEALLLFGLARNAAYVVN